MKDQIAMIVQYLKELQVCAEYEHWITTSYAKHVTLQNLYEGLQEKVDDLVESYIGSYALRNNIIAPTAITIDTKRDIEKVIVGCIEHLHKGIIDTEDMPSIQDHLIDIRKLLDKTMYLLTLK